MTLKIFSIQVQGIKCTNCAGKIKKKIQADFPDVKKVTVNVMQEKVYVTLQNDFLLTKIKQCLNEINFRPLGDAVLVSGGEQTQRTLNFIFPDLQELLSERIVEKLKSMPGIIRVTLNEHKQIKKKRIKLMKKISTIYNCQIVKGRQIIDEMESFQKQFTIFNDRVDGLKNQIKVVADKFELFQCLFLAGFFLLFNMILPQTGSWYDPVLTYPKQLGIYSLLLIINIILTIYTIIRFGKKFILNSYKNLKEYGEMNMQTLVALGSCSAFLFFLFFFVRYTIEFSKGQLNEDMDIMMSIMQLLDSLSSSSLIIVVVTIGKYLQKKAKKKIQKMTDSIFPQSQLFENMDIHYVELKNRNLKIQKQRIYNVGAIQKNDIIKLQQGRLLLDVIIISGETKAIESIITGTQEEVTFQKGDRIRSGSIIIESTGLVQVENVFEKSVLLQIGAQINMAHNSEQNNQMGIQALCKAISNHFVKGVIAFSLIVVTVWSLLLGLKKVSVDQCTICWIVERGVGVLVASCPCALGLAVPSVIAIALNLAIRSGILIRKNIVFEKVKKCNIVAFDKTGTLFTKVEKIEQYKILSQKYPQKDLWQILAVMQKDFRHPLAELLYKQAINRSQVVGTNFKFVLLSKPVLQKQGITGKIKQKNSDEHLKIYIGNKNLFKKYNIKIPVVQTKSDAATCLYLSINQQVCMLNLLNTHSNLRAQAQQIIKNLQDMGKQVHILSGDSKQSVQMLAQILNIPKSCQHPEQSSVMKMEWIKSVQQNKNDGVMMIGDGLNDIPCLQEAQIGVSINAKSELNLNAADIIILSENLHKIVTLFRLMKTSSRFININLLWAFAYNLVMLPIVSGMLFTLNVTISPVWSSIAMSGSSIVVVLFSQLMVCFKYDDSQQRQYNDPTFSETNSSVSKFSHTKSHKSKSYRKLAEEK